MVDRLSFHLEGVVKTRNQTEDFEGPLDLILHLLSRNKIEIKDIEVTLLVDQYLDWIRQREELDLEVASDFVVMASHLVWLKTRMLLAIDDDETREEMEKLIRSLEERQKMEEYRKMRMGSEYLGGRTEIGSSIYVRHAEPLASDRSYRYNHTPTELTSAFDGLRQRAKNKLPPPVSAFQGIVGRERFPVGQKLNMLIQRFIFKPVTLLRELWLDCRGRSELIATFLAVLELCRNGQVLVEEEGGEVTLKSSDTTDGVASGNG